MLITQGTFSHYRCSSTDNMASVLAGSNECLLQVFFVFCNVKIKHSAVTIRQSLPVGSC